MGDLQALAGTARLGQLGLQDLEALLGRLQLGGEELGLAGRGLLLVEEAVCGQGEEERRASTEARRAAAVGVQLTGRLAQ